MKKECEIVQDLLFGYQDGTLHTASKELVETHLEKCKECKNVFDDMRKDEIESEESQEKEIDYLKKVKKKMSKKNKLLIIIGIILGIIVLLNIGIFVYYYHEAGKIEIYLNDDITEDQMESIRNSVTNIDGNAKFEYYSKEDSLNQMKEKFKDREDLFNGYNKDNNPLPAYYVVDTNIEDAKKIESKISSFQGVRRVSSILDSNPYLFAFSKIIMEVKNN